MTATITTNNHRYQAQRSTAGMRGDERLGATYEDRACCVYFFVSGCPAAWERHRASVILLYMGVEMATASLGQSGPCSGQKEQQPRRAARRHAGAPLHATDRQALNSCYARTGGLSSIHKNTNRHGVGAPTDCHVQTALTPPCHPLIFIVLDDALRSPLRLT